MARPRLTEEQKNFEKLFMPSIGMIARQFPAKENEAFAVLHALQRASVALTHPNVQMRGHEFEIMNAARGNVVSAGSFRDIY